MYQPLVVWVELEANPALHVLCEIGVQALDSLPLPLLVVAFLALLAWARYPTKTDYHLPTYSPPIEKSRLSPIPNTSPSLFPSHCSLSTPSPSSSSSPSFSSTSSSSTCDPISTASTSSTSSSSLPISRPPLESPHYLATLHDPKDTTQNPIYSTYPSRPNCGSAPGPSPRLGGTGTNLMGTGVGLGRRGSKQRYHERRKSSLGVVPECIEEKAEV